MSFLAGRSAAAEGAYFFQESKQAVTRLLKDPNNRKIVKTITENNESSTADVLPEILRHSLPPKIFQSEISDSNSNSLSRASKWVLQSDAKNMRASSDALNPLKGYVSLPQVTFGPRRWQVPDSENSILASTANDLRQDKYTPLNPEKLKAAAAGLSQIGSAFAIATAIVFGGAAVIFGMAASKMEVHNTIELRSKGKDVVQPKLETFRENLTPLRNWAEDMSKKWHFEKQESYKEKPLIKELARKLGSKV